MNAAGDAHAKLRAARARLILERPFIGALVMHLPLTAADARWCNTIATDARAFYFNPEYVGSLDLAETQFVLAHAALHCALRHFARRAHRTLRRWDVACDYAVNQLLADDGLKAPRDALLERAYRGMSAEEIYPLIAPERERSTLDRHLADEAGAAQGPGARGATPHSRDGESGRGELMRRAVGELDAWDDAEDCHSRGHASQAPPREPSPTEREALAVAWHGRLAAASQHARHAGRLSGSWMRLVSDFAAPVLPWRMLLSRYMMSAARDDYSFRRPARREGDALMPRLANGEGDVCVALDTSGSIAPGELADFAAEVDSLKSQMRARVTLLACDERLDARAPWRFDPWEPLVLPPDFEGGGGTSFEPVFDWISAAHYSPDVLVYFTDGEGDFPASAPQFPVVWLVKGKARVPWGERIQLN